MQNTHPSLLPCASCPWRTNTDARKIPNYNHDKACGLLNTVGDGDAFRPIMACHCSNEGEEYACKGYLAQAGWSNIAVRLLLAKNLILNPGLIWEACNIAGIELEPNYEKVLEKLAKSI